MVYEKERGKSMVVVIAIGGSAPTHCPTLKYEKAHKVECSILPLAAIEGRRPKATGIIGLNPRIILLRRLVASLKNCTQYGREQKVGETFKTTPLVCKFSRRSQGWSSIEVMPRYAS
jgi:hypothetical protein